MPKTTENWIQVFKPGTHIDSEGVERVYTIDDVTAIANTYNEAIATDSSLEAPIVKGHPENEDPAYGWVEKLKVEGEILWAKLKDVVPSFAEEVNNGMFKKVSISTYADGMLRHIGFLGAVPPAVKGLQNVSFAENKLFTAHTIDFAEPSPAEDGSATKLEVPIEMLSKDQLKKTLEQMVKASLKTENKNFSKYTEDNMSDYFKLLSQFVTDWLTTNGNPEMASNFQAEIAKWIEQNPEPSPADTPPADGVNLAEPNPEVEALKKQVAELEARNRTASYNEYLNSQKNLTPAQRSQFLPLMEMAFNQDATNKVISFSEGGKEHKTTASELVKTLASAVPSSVDFNENTVGKDEKTKNKKSDKYESESAENHLKVIEYQESEFAKGRVVSYQLAAKIIMTGEKTNG